MNTKRKIISALLIMVLALFSIMAVSCNDPGPAPEFPEIGVYSYADGDDEFSLILSTGNTFTVVDGNSTESGSYTLTDGLLVLDFNAEGKENVSATYADTVVTLEYDGANMRLLKKINYTVSFEENGGSAVDNQTVVNGKLATEPTAPTRTGYDFIGWYADAQYSEVFNFSAPISANVTAYAKWEKIVVDTQLPDPVVEVTSTLVSWNSIAGARSYIVSIIAPDGEVVYEQSTSANLHEISFEQLEAAIYTVRVTAVANSGEQDNSSVEVTYNHNALAKVDGFKVDGGTMLIFNTVENAEKYYVTVVCGNPDHNHTSFDNGSNRFFNISNCPMTADGIKVTVTATATGFASSTSDEFVYKRELSAVEGLRFDEATQSVIWNEVANAERYMVSVKCGDESHNHGFVNNGTANFVSLKECAPLAGGIVVKVYPVTDGYISPAASEFAYEKTALQTPTGLTVNGTVISWGEVEAADKYEIKINNETYEVMTDSFDMASLLNYVEGTEYRITVRAVDGSNSSAWTDTVSARYYAMGNLVNYSESTLTWAPVIGVANFEIQVNDGDIITVAGNVNSARVALTKAGLNTVKVRFADGKIRSEWVSCEVYAHAVTFDTLGGSEIIVVYKAVGDRMDLPTAVKPGYTFVDWYNVPGGAESNGKAYTDEFFTGSGSMVLYASYIANEYEITYEYGNGGTGTALVGKVPYNGHYQLEVPTANDATIAFGGWFSAPYGMGIQYTDQDGNSLAPWDTIGGGKMYAFWADPSLSFTLTKVNGKDAYMVSAGDRISLVTEVNIPATYKGLPVAMIAGNAFYNCTNLKTINLPATIEQISQISPFAGCTALEAINVYAVDGVSARFWSQDGVLFDNGTAQTAQPRLFFMPTAKTGTYNIPEGITEIPENAFAGSSITKVVIPASVTRIGREAFANAQNLLSVVFSTASGEQPLTIGDRAFVGCTSLEKITLPARLTGIKLQKYAIVDGAVKLDTAEDAFAGCTALSSITVATGNAAYKSVNGVLYSADGRTLVYVPAAIAAEDGSFAVPAGTQTIAPGAFAACETLTEVSIPNTVTLVGEAAFYGLENLESVSFASGALTDLTIGKYAFSACTALSEVGIKNSRLVTLSDNAFAGCAALTSFELPATVTHVGASAFSGCSTLASITINASNKALTFGENVFNNCTALTRVELPANVSEIPGIFNGCTSLTEVVVDPASEYFTAEDGVLFNKDKTELLFFPGGKTGEYTVPATVKVIANGVFRGNSSLSTINIPNTIEVIGDDAFRDTSIDDIYFVGETFADSLTIGKSAFEGAEFYEIELPQHTKTIGEYAFARSEFYYGIVLNSGIETLGAYAFYDAEFGSWSADPVVIPATVKTIGDYCFAEGEDNYAYVDVEIDAEGSVLEYIGKYAFSGNGLYSFTVPASVKVIDDYAFFECDYLGYYPSYYGGFAFAPESTLETIGNYAFYYCGFEELTIPKTVKKIGAYAFANCGDLETVTFEEGGTDDLVLGSNFTYTYLQNDVPITQTDRGHVFYQCRYLETVTLPERLVEIGEYSFYSAGAGLWSGNLTVSFGENSRLATIGDYAFQYANLVSITIPKSVRNLDPVLDPDTGITYDRLGIGKYAFYFLYDSLTTVIFEDGGTGELTIGEGAFDTCRLLETIELPARLAPYTSYTGEVIPPLASGVFNETDALKSVTVSGTDGYYASVGGVLYTADMTELVLCPSAMEGTVSVPATVTKIHDRAFYGCAALEAVTFVGGENDMTIGDEAFAECDTIIEMTLPNNLKTLGKNVFSGCSELAILSLPAGLVGFDSSVVDNCPNLSTINIGSGTDAGFILVGGVMFSADGTKLIYYPATLDATSYTVPDGVKYIADGAFKGNTELVSVTLPEGLLEIGKAAFQGCTYLESVNVPGSVILIDNEAFSGCSRLSTVTLDDSDNALVIGNKVFYNNSALTGIELPARLAEIGEQAFYNSALAEIEFAENINLAAIGEMAFYSTDLVSVTLPDGIVSIGSAAFYGCYSLESVTFGEGLLSLGDKTFTDCDSLVEVHFPASLRTIGKNTFSNNSNRDGSGCANLKIVTFAPGSRLEAIPEGTFAYTGIETITIPASVKELSDKDLEDEYSFGAFKCCESLTTVIFEDGTACTKIGNFTFYQCTALDDFVIPSSVITIGESAFEECTSLSSILIPAATTQLGFEAFRSCSSLATVVLNTRATELPGYMFAYCYALETVTIPATVSTIGSNCFDGCVSAFEVERGSSHFAAVDGVLYTADMTGFVLYPANKTDSVITIPKEITVIPEGLFSGNDYLRKVIFEAGDTDPLVIEDEAFRGCDNLYEVVLPNRLTYIGECAFMYCYQLHTVNLPRDLKEIGYDAFYGCYKLVEVYNESSLSITLDDYGDYGYVVSYALNLYTPTEGATILTTDGDFVLFDYEGDTYLLAYIGDDTAITIPEGVDGFYDSAFAGNTTLENVIIPAGVGEVYMGDDVFEDCENLTILVESATVSWSSGWNCDCAFILGWDGEEHTYVFESNGGTVYDDITTSMTITLPTPERTDMYFVGWYDNAEFEGAALSGSYYSATKTTLYAKWLTEAEWIEEQMRGKSMDFAFEGVSGGKYVGVVETEGGQVYLVVTVDAGEVWNITTKHIEGPSRDHAIWIYDEDQNVIKNKYDGGGYEENYNYTFTEAGTYYIGVGYWSSYQTGTIEVTLTKVS